MPLLMIMRHGEAVSKEQAGSDEERWLTNEGKRQVECAARLLTIKPLLILTSPLKRARETAEIVARVHGVEYKVVEWLSPGKLNMDNMLRYGVSDRTLLVGHAPDVNNLISVFIGGGNVKLAAGSIAVLEYEKLEPGSATLRLLIAPKLVQCP